MSVIWSTTFDFGLAAFMEEGYGIFQDNNEEDDFEDIEMLDAEGEFVKHDSVLGAGECSCQDGKTVRQESKSKKRRRGGNKKKNKRWKSGFGLNVTDINRFVLDTCKLLKEKKSYMVYTAVGCLGVSALKDLVKEVDAIQACGGQMTADGKGLRTGGGILWSIIKTREPNAYNEIMKKAKEFEKQFRQQNVRQVSEQTKDSSPGLDDFSEGSQPAPQSQNQNEKSESKGKRVSIHDRLG